MRLDSLTSSLLVVVLVAVTAFLPAQPRLEILGATILYPEGRRAAAFKYHDAYREARVRVRQVTGALPPPNVLIELVPDIDDLNEVLERAGARAVPAWVMGVALPEARRIVIRLDIRRPDPERYSGLLIHELCHVVAHAVVSGPDAQPIPRWFDEGLAQLAEGRPFSPERPDLAMRAFFRQLISLDELESSFPSSEGASGLAYAEAKSFVEWLSKAVPNQPLRRVLHRLRDGFTIDEAVYDVFLEPLASLEQRWHHDLRSDRSWVAGTLLQLSVGVLLLLLTFAGASRIVLRRRRAEEEMDRAEAEEAEEAEEADRAPPPGWSTGPRPRIRRLRDDEAPPSV